MARQMPWEEEEDLFESKRFTKRDISKIYSEVIPFNRQLDGVPNWLHLYKKSTYYPSWHYDLRQFHNDIRLEVFKKFRKGVKDF